MKEEPSIVEDNEDADPLTDENEVAASEVKELPVEQAEIFSEKSENEGVHRVIHKKNGTLIFTKNDNYDQRFKR